MFQINLHFHNYVKLSSFHSDLHVFVPKIKYSGIPLLQPPKVKTFYPLKSLFAKFK